MLLVKKCNFFQFLFSVKMRLERLPHAFGQKMHFFFHYLFSLKIRLERRFNNILGRKKTYFDYERKILYGLKSRLFLKGLTHAFGQIMPIFICFRSKQDYK